MKIREVDSYRIGLSIGEVEYILTCKETVKLCVKLLEMAVWVSEKADSPALLVQTSEDEGGAIG